jgi:hypothetical protein
MMPSDGMWTKISDFKANSVSNYPDSSRVEADYTPSTACRTQLSFDAYRTSSLPAPLVGLLSEHPLYEADLMDTGDPRMNHRLSSLHQNRLNPMYFNSGSDDVLPYPRHGQHWDALEQNAHPRMVEQPSGNKVAPNINQIDCSKFSSSKSMLQNIAGRSVVRKPETVIESEIDMNLPFPVKLHYILSHPDYQQYLTWLPHGRAWRILNPKWFEEKVIPMYFRSHKYTSFMRQVSQRITLYVISCNLRLITHLVQLFSILFR